MNKFAKQIFWQILYAGFPFLPFVCTTLHADNYQITIDGLYKRNVVSSPEVADMQYNCVNSIDYSTGQVDIRIPLFEVECGALKLPIYLSYKSSGIKISEPSGWVGQNWTLHAEPVISHVPKGHIDNDLTCEFDPINTILDAEELTDPNLYSGIDAMPDEYYYSLPTSSGMFMYSKGHISEDSMYVCLPFDDVKVTKDDHVVFRMTDADGTRYSFGGGRETNQVGHNYVSAWHASSIVAANGEDSIAFSYGNSFHYSIVRHIDHYTVVDAMMGEAGGWIQGNPYVNLSPYASAEYPDIEPLLITPIVYETFDTSTKSYYADYYGNLVWEWQRVVDGVPFIPNLEIHGDRLSSIMYHGNTLTFTDEAIDNDQNRKRLKRITVRNGLSQTIRSIDFSYIDGYVNTGRYYLSSVAITGGTDTARYVFDYESLFDSNFRGVPCCSSRELDFWGYWTNVSRPSSETLVPRMTLYTSTPQAGEYTYNYISGSLTLGVKAIGAVGKSRASNETFMRIGSLKSITYPTGLKDIFRFEANRARIGTGISDENSSFDIREHLLCGSDSIFQLGGLRIKEILSVEGSDTLLRRSFTYGANEDGAGITPVLGRVNYFLKESTKRYFKAGRLGWEYACSSRYRTLSSEPVIPLTYGNGSSVKYTYVTEYNGTPEDNTGKTVYKYNMPQYEPNNSSAIIHFQNRIEDPTVNRYGIMGADHLEQKTLYKRNPTGYGYTEIERDTYHYDLAMKTSITVVGSEVGFETCGGFPQGWKWMQNFHVNEYSCRPSVYLLQEIDHKVTQENGTATTTTRYYYNNAHDKQLTSKTLSRDGQPAMMESYLHPQQMGEGAPYRDMTDRNILSPIIRTTCSRNGRSFYKENPYSAFTNHLGGTMYLP